jgi:hypothetical protein
MSASREETQNALDVNVYSMCSFNIILMYCLFFKAIEPMNVCQLFSHVTSLFNHITPIAKRFP